MAATQQPSVWVAARIACTACSHLWAAVRPSPCALPLQCPACGELAGLPTHEAQQPPADLTTSGTPP